MKKITLFILTAMLAAPVFAEIKAGPFEYNQGKTICDGYLVYDDAFMGKRPGVVVAHAWMGLGRHEKESAEKLAQLGYVVLAADIYGQGVRPKNAEEAGKLATGYKENRTLLRARIQSAVEALSKHSLVDSTKMAAIGYCFGGTTVLELARAGSRVKGVVSFHGNLTSPTPNDAKNIKSRILVLHGANDPYAPLADRTAFEEEMKKANVDWQMVVYANAVHSFTDIDAGADNSKGAAYNEKADQRSWEAMKTFLSEIFK